MLHLWKSANFSLWWSTSFSKDWLYLLLLFYFLCFSVSTTIFEIYHLIIILTFLLFLCRLFINWSQLLSYFRISFISWFWIPFFTWSSSFLWKDRAFLFDLSIQKLFNLWFWFRLAHNASLLQPFNPKNLTITLLLLSQFMISYTFHHRVISFNNWCVRWRTCDTILNAWIELFIAIVDNSMINNAFLYFQ